MVKYGHLWTEGKGGKGPCGRPQDVAFSELFQPALQTLPMGDGNLKYKLLFVLSDLHHRAYGLALRPTTILFLGRGC